MKKIVLTIMLMLICSLSMMSQAYDWEFKKDGSHSPNAIRNFSDAIELSDGSFVINAPESFYFNKTMYGRFPTPHPSLVKCDPFGSEIVDKTFYIEVARKRINDYLGIKPEKQKKGRTKKMAETKTKNVYQKLLEARIKFLASSPEKSGMNMHMAFKYFELDDIVPIASKIFDEVGLISINNFTSDTANMIIVNTDNPDENIFFTAPFNQIQPIVSNAGKQATNEMQALGSSITYMRRYLYMIALDICEPDSIDAAAPTTKPVEPKAPVTPQKKEDKPLTDSTSNATDLQIKQMKDLLKKLREVDPSKEEWIAQIAVDTQGFKVISKAECEALVKEINDVLKEEAK